MHDAAHREDRGPDEPSTARDGRSSPHGFASDSAVSVIGNALAVLLSFAWTSLLGRALGPAEYGDVASSLSLGYLFVLFASPVEAAFVKAVADARGRGRAEQSGRLALDALRKLAPSFAGLFVAWIPLSFLVRDWLRMRGVGALLWLAALCGLWACAAIVRGLLQGAQRFRAYVATQVIDAAGRLVVGVSLLALGARAAGGLAAYVAGAALMIAASLWSSRDLLSRRGRAPAASTLASSFSFFFVFGFVAFCTNVDVLAAKRFLSPAEAGRYGAAMSLARVVCVMAIPVQQVLLSHVADLHARQRDPARLVRLVVGVATLLLGVGFCVPAFFASPLLTFVFGAEFAASAPVLRVQWLTASLLSIEQLVLVAWIGTSKRHESSLLLLPCLLMVALLAFFHGTPTQIAWCGFASAASALPLIACLRYASRRAER